MTELSIKLKIGDREYPMKVSSADEARIRKAGKLINDKIKAYRNRFGINDKQDLLAMVAFDCIVEKMESDAHSTGSDSLVNEKLDEINALLSHALK